jgi:hypothetical protein
MVLDAQARGKRPGSAACDTPSVVIPRILTRGVCPTPQKGILWGACEGTLRS